MALYENGKRISGIRDFPAYTWAEYQALPVAQRPKVWKCTDRDYTEIPIDFKSQTLNVTTGHNGDVGLGLYSADIQIVTVYANTWANVGLYLVNGEWGIRADQKNTTLSITITYYDV